MEGARGLILRAMVGGAVCLCRSRGGMGFRGSEKEEPPGAAGLRQGGALAAEWGSTLVRWGHWEGTSDVGGAGASEQRRGCWEAAGCSGPELERGPRLRSDGGVSSRVGSPRAWE